MIQQKKHFLKVVHSHIGGGGFHCDCCVSPKRKTRKQLLRGMRRTYNQMISKMVQEELD
jgi:hypothetical protein